MILSDYSVQTLNLYTDLVDAPMSCFLQLLLDYYESFIITSDNFISIQ